MVPETNSLDKKEKLSERSKKKRLSPLWWVPWVGAGALGTIGLSLCEYLLIRLDIAGFEDSVGGIFHALSLFTSVFLISSLPLMLAGVLFEKWVGLNRKFDTAWFTAVILGSLFILVGLSRAEQLLEGAPPEFPDAIHGLAIVLRAGVVILGVFAMKFLWFPALRRLFISYPLLASPVVVLGGASSMGAIAGLLIIHALLAPVYLVQEAGAVALLTLICALVAGRIVLSFFSRRVSVVLVVLGSAAVLFSSMIPSPTASFLLFSHGSSTGPLAVFLRNLVDFDGDGAAPSWLGGTDCAEFDTTRGPMRREVLGDGVDQDCRGGDAPLSEKTRPKGTIEAPLWANCQKEAGTLSFLLLSIDALRFDALNPVLMPGLSELSKASTVFERAYVASPLTFASIGTIFSGRPLSDLGMANPVAENTFVLDRNGPEEFSRAGYRTGAFEYFGVDARLLAGFKVINPGEFDINPLGIKYQLGAATMSNQLIQFIDRDAGRFFVWAHFPDAHAPYLTPYILKRLKLPPYQASLNYIDRQINRVLRHLEEKHKLENTVVVITADHGEELRQHGHEGHGPQLYEESVHVPLLVRVPGCAPALVHGPTSLIGLLGSLADLGGLSKKIRGPRLDDSKDLNFVVTEEAPTTGVSFKRAVVTKRFKLVVDVQNGGKALFDLETDPGELENIYTKSPQEAQRLEHLYQGWLDRIRES